MPSSEVITKLVRASALNQHGAALLLGGRVYEAAKCFELALATMQVKVPSFLDRPFPIASLQGAFQIYESHGFVYSKPFFFNQQAEPSEAEVSSYLAIITFNLALTYQTVGQQLRDGGKFLMMAKSLYESCLALLNCQRQYDCSNVIIACLNNMACLSVELSKPGEAYQMLLWLEMLIKEGKVRTDTLHGDDIADVVLNIRILLMPVCAGAA